MNDFRKRVRDDLIANRVIVNEVSSSALTGLLYASLAAMSHDGVGTLNCSHVDTVSGAPNCCTSCHDDHDMGFNSLYEDEDDKIPVQHCLCCAKRNWLTGI